MVARHSVHNDSRRRPRCCPWVTVRRQPGFRVFPVTINYMPYLHVICIFFAVISTSREYNESFRKREKKGTFHLLNPQPADEWAMQTVADSNCLGNSRRAPLTLRLFEARLIADKRRTLTTLLLPALKNIDLWAGVGVWKRFQIGGQSKPESMSRELPSSADDGWHKK